MTELNKILIRDFWRAQSAKSSNRWTQKSLLDYEINYLSELRSKDSMPFNILDLGSGAGELSRSIQKNGDTLVAVDFESNYHRFFRESDMQFFKSADVASFEIDEKFDLVLLYGVVTHLTELEEEKVYRKIHNLIKVNGVGVIKHQVSRDEEIVVNSFSNALGQEYSARYPSQFVTETKLKSLFKKVEILEYPSIFNRFENTRHIAYLVGK